MFCASCGRQNEAGVRFCTACGESLQGAGENSALPPQTPILGGGGSAGASANPWPSPPPLPPAGGFSPLPPSSLPPVSGPGGSGLPIKPMIVGLVVLALLGFVLSRGRGRVTPMPTPTVAVASSPVAVASPIPVETPPASPSTTPITASPAASAPVALPTRAGATTRVVLTDAEMCRAVDNEGRALNATNRFEPTWPFFCSVQARGLKKGVTLVAFWQSPTGKTNKRELVSDRVGDYTLYFSLSPRPNTSWDLGVYRLSLIVDGVLQQTLTFEVVPKVDAESPSASLGHVQEAVVCAAVDARHRPLNPTSTFPSATSAVYVTTRVRDVTRGKTVVTRWYLEDRKIKEISLAVPRDGSGWLSFKLSNTKAWPLGQYKVDVLYDGTLARTVSFSVR